MSRRVAFELAAVIVLYAICAFAWLHPASALLFTDGRTMIGEASDSLTNPWQYQIVLEQARHAPWRLLYGALYTDRIGAPEGYAVFIPLSERLLVLALAPLLDAGRMPTAVVAAYMIGSAAAMHACGRLLGWPRLVAFALGLAWAICPHTRARAECHIALVGVYFAPATVMALRLAAGAPPALAWSRRRSLLVASALLLAAAASAHYYAMLLVAFSPLLIALFLLLRDAPLRSAPRDLGWTALAASPGLLLLLATQLAPVPREAAGRLAAAAPESASVEEQRQRSLRVFGAQPMDYLGGDVRFGDRDLLPFRPAITREIRRQTPVNSHERTNGVRWTLLGASAALAIALTSRRLRRRGTTTARRVGAWALVLGVIAFFTSFAVDDLHVFGVDVAPVRLVARVLPSFRVSNRVGVLVHFAAAIATGTLAAEIARALAARARGPQRDERRTALAISSAPGAALLVLVLLEYLPLHPVIVAPVPEARRDLDPPAGACGDGILVPYVTYDFQAEDYYAAMSELRESSCKVLHTAYLSSADKVLLARLGAATFDEEAVQRHVSFARCTRARWVMFRLDPPETFRRAVCEELGFTFVAHDMCRATTALEPPRSTYECAP